MAGRGKDYALRMVIHLDLAPTGGRPRRLFPPRKKTHRPYEPDKYQPVARWDRHLRSKYGMEAGQWDAMLREQSGRCLCCGDPLVEPRVDHCHATGRVRGLLCPQCNTGLGHFRDDPERLRLGIEYLSRP